MRPIKPRKKFFSRMRLRLISVQKSISLPQIAFFFVVAVITLRPGNYLKFLQLSDTRAMLFLRCPGASNHRDILPLSRLTINHFVDYRAPSQLVSQSIACTMCGANRGGNHTINDVVGFFFCFALSRALLTVITAGSVFVSLNLETVRATK